jgi:hypothetical protein
MLTIISRHWESANFAHCQVVLYAHRYPHANDAITLATLLTQLPNNANCAPYRTVSNVRH